MAVIPLNQRVTIRPFIDNDPDWNKPIYGDPYEMKCRFQEEVKLVRNKHGAEVVSSAHIIFDRLASVGIDDKITHINELGTETSYDPIAIEVKRHISGKPWFTFVYV